MAHVQAAQISHSFGDRNILVDVTLPIAAGSRTALAGDNGSGKSTLLRIIAGEITPDSGNIVRQKDAIITYLPQSGVVHSGSSLFDECEGAFGRFSALLEEKRRIELDLADSQEGDSSLEPLLQRHYDIEELLLDSAYYRREEQVFRVLSGLGFAESDLDRDTVEFSGGWQMRIALAKVLLEKPDVLLLDEPTNYLDIEARTWLEEFLGAYRGGVIVVSHDRYFLDVTVSAVAELFNGSLTIYPGNYTEYRQRRESELRTVLAAYRKQQEEIQKLEDFIRRFRYNASKAAQVQSRVKQLESLHLIEVPESMKRIHFTFPNAPHSGKMVVRALKLTKSYGNLHALRGVSFELERGEKLVIAGKNGAGKSTLMRILSGRERHFEGQLVLGAQVEVGYFSQEIDELDDRSTVLEEAESASPTSLLPTLRNLLGAFLFRGDDVFKRVAVLSGGERNRLALLKLLLNPINLLILDEPTNHLDMASKEVLLDALKSYNGTLVFVSHDRYFIEDLADRVLELRDGEAQLFPGDYAYYLRRISGDNSEDPSEEPEAPAAQASGKEERERQRRVKSELRQLEREEQDIMDRLEELEAARSDVMTEMSAPEVFGDGETIKMLKAKLSTNEEEQNRLSERWHRLESLRKELERSVR